MSPHIFFVLLLLAVLAAGMLVMLYYVLRPQNKNKNSRSVSEEDIQKFFGDEPLQKSILNLKKNLSQRYFCSKCGAKSHLFSIFDDDLYEAYCSDCGLKQFYNLDVVAGMFRTSKKTRNICRKTWLQDSQGIPCNQCRNKNFARLEMELDARYKFTGYGDTKNFIFQLVSCKSCGLTQFFNPVKA